MKTMKRLTGCDLLKTSKVTKLFLIVTGLFFITSCATTYTHIVSSWTNEDYQEKSYEKVMVLGVSENNSVRGTVESALVKRLTEKNIPAVSSLNLFPDALQNRLLTKEEIVSALKSKSIDALLVVSLLDIKEEQNYVPGYTYTEPVHHYHNHPAYYNPRYPYYNTPYYGYYSTAYRTVHEPGYHVNTKKVYLETNFYSVEMEGLVWTAQSESIDPNNVGELSIQYAEIVVSAMLQDKLFDLSEK